MSINYEVYKNNNSKNSAYGKYFGRVVIKSIVDTDTLADLIQQNVSVKESDVYAVLKELKNAVRQSFDNGNYFDSCRKRRRKNCFGICRQFRNRRFRRFLK